MAFQVEGSCHAACCAVSRIDRHPIAKQQSQRVTASALNASSSSKEQPPLRTPRANETRTHLCSPDRGSGSCGQTAAAKKPQETAQPLRPKGQAALC
eukprot:1036894-Pleurochrysis_carterae.AAC.1